MSNPVRATRKFKPLIGIVTLVSAAVMVAAASNWLPQASAQASADEEATLQALRTAVSQMEDRVQRLRDIDEIENLVSIYGYYLDKALWDQVTDLFTEDGTIEISQRGVYVGKESIRRSLELYGPEPLQHAHLHNHIQLQPLINLSADGQTGYVRSRALSQLGTFGQAGVWGDGVYENVFVKEDGVWKIKTDHVYTTFFAIYDKGFIGGARGAPQPSTDIPPDLPPSVLYDPFPGIFVPEFHYVHPVTGEEIIEPAPISAQMEGAQ